MYKFQAHKTQTHLKHSWGQDSYSEGRRVKWMNAWGVLTYAHTNTQDLLYSLSSQIAELGLYSQVKEWKDLL